MSDLVQRFGAYRTVYGPNRTARNEIVHAVLVSDYDALLARCEAAEARLAEAKRLLYECQATLKHAAVFVRTREKMHPAGVELYDALLARLADALTLAPWCDTCEGEPETGTYRGCRAGQEPPR